VARGVGLDHRSRCGPSRTQRARGSRQRRREPAQADQSDTCESMWPGISAALFAPWNPGAAAVLAGPAVAAPLLLPQRHLGSTSRLSVPDEPPPGAADKLTPIISWPGGAALGLLVGRMTNSSICHLPWLVDNTPSPPRAATRPSVRPRTITTCRDRLRALHHCPSKRPSTARHCPSQDGTARMAHAS